MSLALIGAVGAFTGTVNFCVLPLPRAKFTEPRLIVEAGLTSVLPVILPVESFVTVTLVRKILTLPLPLDPPELPTVNFIFPKSPGNSKPGRESPVSLTS